MKISNQMIVDSHLIFEKIDNFYYVRKDSHGYLTSISIMAIDDIVLNKFLNDKDFKITVIDQNKEVIKSTCEGHYDMSLVNDLLDNAEVDYSQKLKQIDEALDKKDEALFIKLTSELYGGNGYVS